MLKVLVLSNSPTPYNDALFRELHRQPGVNLKVAYCTWLEPHRLWRLASDKGYEYVVLPGVSFRGVAHLNPGIVGLIRRFRPDVAVLSGSYAMPTLHLAALTLRGSQVPWIYWGEELSFQSAPWHVRAVRTLLRRVLMGASGVLAIGTRARRSYTRVGFPEARIADFRYYADIARFQFAAPARDEARAALRSSWEAASETPVFLYCGQLIRRKSVDTLLYAAAALRHDGISAVVVVVGAGADEPTLRALVRELGIDDSVRFLGFVQPEDLPRYFAAADAFVVPSLQEGWGVVVPEALAAGLPVLASESVNAAIDLVVDGESGYRFPPGDSAALASAMRELCESPQRRAQMAESARAAVREETPEHAASRLVALSRAVLSGRDIAATDGSVGIHAAWS